MNNAIVINKVGNISVVKLNERNFPGILVQGDSMKILLDDVKELRKEIKSENIQVSLEIANDIEEKLNEWIELYKSSLYENNYEIPFNEN